MPDDHYNPINDNTYTLQHYLNNTNKYFTSDTQLYFLPGQYFLNNDLIIQDVTNFSLIGNRTNEVISTVFNCTSPAGVRLYGCTNIVIDSIAMNECGNNNPINGDTYINSLTALYVLYCESFTLIYFCSLCNNEVCGIELTNTLKSKLTNVTSNFLLIRYTGTDKSTSTNKTNIYSIKNFQNCSADALFIKHFLAYSVRKDIPMKDIAWINTVFDFQATVLNINFAKDMTLSVACLECLGQGTVTVVNCSFSSMINNVAINDYNYNYNKRTHRCKHSICTTKILIKYAYASNGENSHNPNKLINFTMTECYFLNNSEKATILRYEMTILNNQAPLIVIKNCVFYNNKNTQLISAMTHCHSDDGSIFLICGSMLIKNSIIHYNTHDWAYRLIFALSIKLFLGQVTINNNVMNSSRAIIICSYSITYSKYNEFSKNVAGYALLGKKIYVHENSVLQVTLNTFKYEYISMLQAPENDIGKCAIQYISERGNLDQEFQMVKAINYSINFNNNNMSRISNIDLQHCEWDIPSVFYTSRPAHVNHRFIHTQHNNFYSLGLFNERMLCLCNENMSIDCYTEELGPFYPGETVSFTFILISNIEGAELLEKCHYSHIACKSYKFNSIHLPNQTCKNIKYTINHENEKWCELCFKIVAINKIELYTITLLPCPKGFSLHLEGYCYCDLRLSSHIPSLTHCNIDDQTISRPANSWISAHTVNNSHYYHVSLHCPFDYCLPHSSHLNLSSPDSQCQFDRSGLLCGQCQQGLSAVFGSSECKQCSNVFLLIIIPIVIAGFILVLLLFAFNLTVTDGNINGFLFYVNVISINNPIFFSPNNYAITNTFISLSNLDLGIATCFYNGMDNYAKMWLQLIFPAYIILIAIILIAISHHSIRVRRLTVHKALPVLATLFLLSYTKVLLTVSSTLFFYTVITHLPSNHVTIVWSVDANVPLFRVRFTILFITCFILFLLLVPFNMSLVFTRQLSRFKHINCLKPLLDAYQGTYKNKFYFWTGLQLLVRAILFGLSAVDRNINLLISSILFVILIC